MLELDIALCSYIEHVGWLLPLAPSQEQRPIYFELAQSSNTNFILSNVILK